MFMLCSNNSVAETAMFAMPGMRAFSLAAGRDIQRVSCDADGVFIGDVPLLRRRAASHGDEQWNVRPLAELNDELSALYRLPIDIAAKARALGLIANALSRGDLATVAIVTVQMQFPDPPPLTKTEETTNALMRRALELHRSQLLKADPDWEAKHPRTGAPPNPGWFAPVPRELKPPIAGPGRPSWPLPHVNQAARDFARSIPQLAARTFIGRLFGGLIRDRRIKVFLAVFTPIELNQGEDRLTAQLKSASDAPKTLEELQQRPTQNILGYVQHHIVEQHDDNVRKKEIYKFGGARIDDPSNLVWVPYFPHLEISAEYSGVPDNDGGPTLRERVKKHDFDEQRRIGLEMLRERGVLR